MLYHIFFLSASTLLPVTLPKQSKGSVGGQLCLMLIAPTGATVVSYMMRLAHSERLTSLFEHILLEIIMLEFLYAHNFEIFFCLPQARKSRKWRNNSLATKFWEIIKSLQAKIKGRL